ncbi:hypothetical protein H0H87_004878 [Tephrocybe sp. NHM501043]|nr:hypothetical protein H0H87_004878 [Tephrocybe sp. NHM501043]
MPSENKVNQPSQQLPPFASWPTIKILSPPKGRFSPKTDEWCMTYCSQTINGRFHGKEPVCRSVCIRRVFAHEVKNLIAFKTHRNVGPDGKAMYPLPFEGQPANVPRWLGGKPARDEEPDDDEMLHVKSPPEPTKYWDEGWYLWSSQNRWAIHDKLDSMKLDLGRQQQSIQQHQERRELWQEYQDHLQRGDQSAESSKWWGPIVPPRPVPEHSSQSLLVPLPPDFPPFWQKMTNLLAPTQKALNIFHESVQSGEQREFAGRVWEKARTIEPFVVAGKAFGIWYQLLKASDSPSDDDKKST